MAKFSRKGKGGLPAINTASMPDVVFMLLFFFMVATQLRETTRMVIVQVPTASEVAKLERKDLASHISIGEPAPMHHALYGTETRIQLNDSFKSVTDIRDFIAAEREARSEADRPFMTVSLKVDQNVRMGIVTDVKQELRRCSALKIMYSSRRAAPSQ
ncbi:MAG: biopolymer transporter ExbD [Prevotellaceae bacterium]|jgi:biopolymer transport protein ExbD|nr:biopolymer transporter ExbD [Prevotellaceae bacterium]